MRLTDVEARELLSFDTLQLSDLPQTLVVVGPNGGGKTNLLRLLQIILVAIDRAATFSQDAYRTLTRLATSRRLGAAPANVSSVRLGIMLTEPWERELLASFGLVAEVWCNLGKRGLLLQLVGSSSASASSSAVAKMSKSAGSAESRPASSARVDSRATKPFASRIPTPRINHVSRK
jgi:energy-coupling factor transporter ATP-binding protein EcfA2